MCYAGMSIQISNDTLIFFMLNFFLSKPNRTQFKKKLFYIGVRYIGWEVTQGNRTATEIIFKIKKMQIFFILKKLRVVLAEIRILQNWSECNPFCQRWAITHCSCYFCRSRTRFRGHAGMHSSLLNAQ